MFVVNDDDDVTGDGLADVLGADVVVFFLVSVRMISLAMTVTVVT